LSVALFCLLGPHGSQITSHLSSIGGATAEVVKAAGDVASAGANMTVAVSHLAVGAISISVSAAEDFWHGVDLHAAVANRTITKAAGSTPQSIRHWVAEGAGGSLSGEFRRAIFQFAEGFKGSVPVQVGTGQLFRAEGHYFAWQAEMRLLPSGYIGFAVSVVSVSFQPRWSNPLWELAELSPTSEADRILTGVRVVVDRLESLEPDALEVSDATIRSEQLPVLHAASSFGPVATAIFVGALGVGVFAWAWWLGAGILLQGAGAQVLSSAVSDVFEADNDTWVQVPGQPQTAPPQDAQRGASPQGSPFKNIAVSSASGSR
jgi:hypothetical protein